MCKVYFKCTASILYLQVKMCFRFPVQLIKNIVSLQILFWNALQMSWLDILYTCSFRIHKIQHPSNQTFVYSFQYSSTYSFIHSFRCSIIHPTTNSFKLIYSIYIHSFIYTFNNSFAHLYILFISTSIDFPIHSFIYSSFQLTVSFISKGRS